MKTIITIYFIFISFLINAQYTADFSNSGKGVDGGNPAPPVAGCTNQDVTTCPNYDVSGENWTLSSTPFGLPANTFSINTAQDGLYANGTNLYLQDTDGYLCWESPNLSMGGSTQTITVSGNATSIESDEKVTLDWFVDGVHDGHLELVGNGAGGSQSFNFNPTTSAGKYPSISNMC